MSSIQFNPSPAAAAAFRSVFGDDNVSRREVQTKLSDYDSSLAMSTPPKVTYPVAPEQKPEYQTKLSDFSPELRSNGGSGYVSGSKIGRAHV